MDKKASSELAMLSPKPNSPNPGPRTYRISLGPQITNDNREFRISKAKGGRLHDHLWRCFFKEIENFAKKGDEQSNQEEYRLFNSICRSSRCFGDNWPSEIRNAVNYRPGFGYVPVRNFKSQVLRAFRGRILPISLKDALDRFEYELLSLPGNCSPLLQRDTCCRALVLLTAIVNCMTNEIYGEVIGRSGFDRRWSNSRHRYWRKCGFIGSSISWPLKEPNPSLGRNR